MNKVVVGLDIGGTKTIVASADENGRVIKRERALTPRAPGPGLTLIHEMIAEVSQGAEITAIGAAAGGPLDWETGVISPLHQPEWENIALKSMMQEKYGCGFAVDVDTNVAALAEYQHATPKPTRLLYLTISTGLGGSLVIDGMVYRGANGIHPEPGHQAIPYRSALGRAAVCSCGTNGCLEALVSGTGIRRFYRKGPEDLSTDEWEEVSWNLGQGLRNMAVMYLPDVIVIGGGVAFSARNSLVPPAIEVMRDHLKIVPAPRVVTSELGEHNVLAGAILLALQNRTPVAIAGFPESVS